MAQHKRPTEDERLFDFFKKLNLDSRSRVLYLELRALEKKYKNKEGEFYRSMHDLCLDTGWDKNTIKKHKENLQKIGLISYRIGSQNDFKMAGKKRKRPAHIFSLKKSG